jgi:surface protein
MVTAFAIFCATDGSLTFYNRDTVPTVGSTFEGKVASNVYTGFDTASYVANTIPWYNESSSVISVSFMPEFVTVKPISTAFWFSYASNLTSFNSANLDTSNVTNTRLMFQSCEKLTSLDLSSFDTSKVKNMSGMFNFATALTTIYVSDIWSNSAVTDSSDMFRNCKSLVGAVPYDSTKTDASMANYETGYLTYKRYVKPMDMLIKNTTLYDIADKIRILNGSEKDMTPAEMIITISNIRDAKEVAF